MTIKRSTALKIFKENEEDYEKFCYIKDKILMEKDYSILNYRCFHCRSLKHTIHNCPFIHYVPDFEKIIKRHEFYVEAPRKVFKRRHRKRFFRKNILNCAKVFQQKVDEYHFTSKKTKMVDEITEQSQDSQNSVNLESDDLTEEEEDEILNPIARENDIRKSSLAHLDVDIEKERKKHPEILFSDQKMPSLPENSFYETQVSKPPASSIFISTIPDTFKEKNPYLIDKVQHFRNYYPENNCFQIVKRIHSLNNLRKKLNKILSHDLLDKNYKIEMMQKLRKFKQYSFSGGKFHDLILKRIYNKLKIDQESESEKREPPSSPILSPNQRKFKKFSDISGFFERTKGIVEETSWQSITKSALSKLMVKKNMSQIIKPKRRINLKKGSIK